eukprot:15437976-Alexandrium_andersonii.AAC.1
MAISPPAGAVAEVPAALTPPYEVPAAPVPMEAAASEPARRRGGRPWRAAPYDAATSLQPSEGRHPREDGLRGARRAMDRL